jgi:3-dehydroquinate synthase
VHTYSVPSGEASKNREQFWELCTWMIAGGVERRDTLLALGGGVVGDLAGFAAASVLRGITFVQLPTTLLAMVDAAIGGKTGINHPLGKNLVGAFHQPRMVLADTLTLHTLAPRELCAGWAEVIKHGMIRSAPLFAMLEEHAAELGAASAAPTTLPEPLTSDIIRKAAGVKVDVVNADEREQGVRIVLNYGHTLGHALEAATGYGRLLHGEAVAIGMHAAAGIAVALGMLAPDTQERQQRLLAAYGLPTAFPPDIDLAGLLTLTLRDKKVQSKRVRWILPTTIGEVTTRSDVPDELVQRVIGQQGG